MTSSSELLTPDMARRIEQAFGVRPFDFYATTEGLWAVRGARRSSVSPRWPLLAESACATPG